MLLKFYSDKDNIILDSNNYDMIDITKDFRTKMLDKDSMTNKQFYIENNIYILKQQFFINMAKIQNRKSIEALMIRYNDKIIIIVGEKSILYFNGKPIYAYDYNTDIDNEKGISIASISKEIIENE